MAVASYSIVRYWSAKGLFASRGAMIDSNVWCAKNMYGQLNLNEVVVMESVLYSVCSSQKSVCMYVQQVL